MTRKEIELYAKETDGTFHYTAVRDLASALLAEMDKPKVWDGAPDMAICAGVSFYEDNNHGSLLIQVKSVTYSRELPKSRAREIAENIWHEINKGDGSPEDIIESAFIKREAELRGES